ncbi:Alpha/Beta hydrolase protein [Bisporella sp. PMI_857]|nr:Alpha/Beta hydrolase protein [Bisporella sp. PMI_857]
MAYLPWMLLRSPFQSLKLIYSFSIFSCIEILRRILLPHVPVYQSLRTRLFRAYLAAANVHFPEIIHRLPVSAPSSRAKLIETNDFKAYIIPGGADVANLAAPTQEKQNRCVLLYAHGGGYARGEARMYLTYMERWIAVARRRGLDLVFVTVEYPLTDIASHPAQRSSFLAAYRHLLDLEFPPSRILFMGDSAGGALTVLSGLHLQKLSLPQPAGYILLSPWLDHSGATFDGGNPMVETDYLVQANIMVPKFSNWFIGSWNGADPEVNPLFEEEDRIKNLSPQLILVGAAEFALHDSVQWAQFCKKTGVKHKLVREWGQIHIYALGSKWIEREVRERTDGLIFDWIEESLASSS